ncbi:MAG: glycoside hydrolase family 3 protein [Symploca sp. SIO1C2]|nr:glycoside hydrolase family 3 protein [Symploca sp. SIO1C2]
MQAVYHLLWNIVQLLVALAILFVANYLRSPFLANLRFWLFWLVLGLSLSLIISAVIGIKKHRSLLKMLSVLVLIVSFAGFSSILGTEAKFHLVKHQIFSTDANRLEKLGNHFIVGYRDFEGLKKLVEHRAIGGVFITARNIKEQSKADIQQQISTLQGIRQQQGLSPLWIAVDQEGGIVSRLSPPLTQLPPLATIISEEQPIEQSKAAVIKYARVHGQELSEIGVNLNFAPVVDLNKGVVNPQDKFSQIYRRAISADREVVAKVALWYCQTLEEYGVKCTIKHFPGLGRVDTDTHIDHAELDTPLSELVADDWVPFRQVMNNSQAFTMLGHAKLMAVDDQNPVSFSSAVVGDMIRKSWQHDGVLITDDFCMQAVYSSKAGLAAATIEAINAGIDLVLIAFTQDLYYPAMDALLKADQAGILDQVVLDKSYRRLEQAKIISRG